MHVVWAPLQVAGRMPITRVSNALSQSTLARHAVDTIAVFRSKLGGEHKSADAKGAGAGGMDASRATRLHCRAGRRYYRTVRDRQRAGSRRRRVVRNPMVTIQLSNLIDFVADVFSHADSSPEEARRIASYLTTATLTGHDSHGVIPVPVYIRWKKTGSVIPNQTAEVVVDQPSLAVGDGKFGY